MSSDFFADLERQLVTATAERPRRVRRARVRRITATAAGIAAVAVAGAAVAVGARHDGAGPTAAPAAPPSTTTVQVNPRTGAVVPPTEALVAVLNGTTTPGLARNVANRLTARGIHIGTVTNAPSQDETVTHVAFTPGHEQDAATVRAALGLTAPAVPATAAQRAIADPRAAVIVLAADDGAPPAPRLSSRAARRATRTSARP